MTAGSENIDLDLHATDASAPGDFAKVMAGHYGDVVLSPLEEELMRDSGMI